MILKKYNIINRKLVLHQIKMKDKDILFLPMAHLSEEKFYIECKKAIDSLSNNGYYIFGEGIQYEGNLKGKTELYSQDTIYRKKIRKIIGVTISDAFEKKSMLKDIMERYKLVLQPTDMYCSTKSKMNSCRVVDFTGQQLIESYEQVKGEIVLSECDKNTPLEQEYKCTEKIESSDRKFFMNDIVVDKRDQYISKEVKQSNHKKILLIYGEAHYKGIKKLLEDTK
ncbi:MAG: hypothetical protein EAZ44_04635 [Cytophagia bacterium]|nr:MAG: hypothetical protein EAZ44_04635 [Cytophagia bacterium]TAG43389.1 MAG: hypothetical protein EAZ31_04360 [Cytophagia bacterium]